MNKKLLTQISLVVLTIAGAVVFVLFSGGFTIEAIVLLSIVSLFMLYAIPKIVKERNDTVLEDEYSKKMVRIASARSFVVSLYVWLFIMIFSNIIDDLVNPIQKIGIGIVLMAIVFLVNIVILKFKGVKE